MPKKHKIARVAASQLRSWIDRGRASVVPKVGGELLQLRNAIYPTCSRLYLTRSRRGKRMWIPAGSFLNSRWEQVGPRNTEWSFIEALSEQELRERYLIVRIEEDGEVKWYLLIYEVVSSRAQLLRQRVHINAQYANERTRKNILLQAVEREFADHVLGRIRLTVAERSELSNLQRVLTYRLNVVMPYIQTRLAGRDVIAFLDAGVEIEGLKRHHERLVYLADNLGPEIRRPNFSVHLHSIAEKLSAYISPEIRRSVYWSRYHIIQAASDAQAGDIDGCRYHLLRGANHLKAALKTLRSWDASLSKEERRFIPKL